jgi:hypothetical protein
MTIEIVIIQLLCILVIFFQKIGNNFNIKQIEI